jgi:hypothetical protein
MNYMSGLALNFNPPDLSFPSRDSGMSHQHPAHIDFFTLQDKGAERNRGVEKALYTDMQRSPRYAVEREKEMYRMCIMLPFESKREK